MLCGQLFWIQMYISATHCCMAVPRDDGTWTWAAEFALDTGKHPPVARIVQPPEKQKG